jgi:hypothetical protein
VIAQELKWLVMMYWRFQRQYWLVAHEYSYGDADVLSASKNMGVICETEVKVSIADLKRELQKSKHRSDAFGKRFLRTKYVDYFYFAMPLALVNKAIPICDNFFPYAGILSVGSYEEFLKDKRSKYLARSPVKCVKDPVKQFKDGPISESEFNRIARGMSNNYCALAFDYMRMKRGYD